MLKINNNKNCNIKINDKVISNLSAKEMFEKLGYIQDMNNLHYIGYIKSIENTRYQDRMFIFPKNQKYFSFIDDSNNVCITLEELQAINKQVEELQG